jgi:tetratricopeptide (TPR) repeat protein
MSQAPSPTAPGSAPAEGAVARARALIREARFAEAERAAVDGLQALGEDSGGRLRRDLLYVLAVARRFAGRPVEALETLDALHAQAPDYGRGWQERGHLLAKAGRPAEAVPAYERAVQHNPGLLASWKALVELYGDDPAAARRRGLAERQAAHLAALPRELATVTSLLHEGELARADDLCRRFLRGHREHIEGMRLLAAIGERLEVLPDAEFLLETALELDPGNERCRYDYANLLLKMQKFGRAHEQTTRLVEQDPSDLAFLALHANAASGIGDHEHAIALYERVLGEAPAQHRLWVMRGHALKTVGRTPEAIESYREAYRRHRGHGDAYWSLANTKTYRFTAEEIAAMRAQEATPGLDSEDRIHLCFALGKAFEDAGDAATSFTFYERGNRLRLEADPGSMPPPEARVDALVRVCTRPFFEARADVGCTAPDPIFIVGLPRAGSTLLEQILASHSQVDGTLELPDVIALAQRLRREGDPETGTPPLTYPAILEALEPGYFRRFGEKFLEDTRVHRQGAPFFIDKNPNNFFHVGLIRLMLPNAKVVDARRHPLACCLSGFKQLFGQGQEFSYGLREIGAYYREYVRLMDHWDAVLPGFVLRVQHEDVVDDLEGQVRRLLDFCGLPFEAACLEFHRQKRSVRTPSSEQVRQPIYRSGLEAWKPFEPWLDPLKEALGPDVRARYDIADPASG